MSYEYEKALFAKSPERGADEAIMRQENPNHLISMSNLFARRKVVGQEKLEGGRVYYLNPEKNHDTPELKSNWKAVPSYIWIQRPTDAQMSQERSKARR